MRLSALLFLPVVLGAVFTRLPDVGIGSDVVAMDSAGATLAVTDSTNTVHVYEWGTAWTAPSQSLTHTMSGFGEALSVTPTSLAVGAPAAVREGTVEAGAVVVYTRASQLDPFTEEQVLEVPPLSDLAPFSRFGGAVALMSNRRLAVGSQAGGGVTGGGTVFVFERSEAVAGTTALGAWSVTQTLTPAAVGLSPSTQLFFGSALAGAASDDLEALVVGAPAYHPGSGPWPFALVEPPATAVTPGQVFTLSAVRLGDGFGVGDPPPGEPPSLWASLSVGAGRTIDGTVVPGCSLTDDALLWDASSAVLATTHPIDVLGGANITVSLLFCTPPTAPVILSAQSTTLQAFTVSGEASVSVPSSDAPLQFSLSQTPATPTAIVSVTITRASSTSTSVLSPTGAATPTTLPSGVVAPFATAVDAVFTSAPSVVVGVGGSFSVTNTSSRVVHPHAFQLASPAASLTDGAVASLDPGAPSQALVSAVSSSPHVIVSTAVARAFTGTAFVHDHAADPYAVAPAASFSVVGGGVTPVCEAVACFTSASRTEEVLVACTDPAGVAVHECSGCSTSPRCPLVAGGVSFSPTVLTIVEGGVDTYVITLRAVPLAPVSFGVVASVVDTDGPDVTPLGTPPLPSIVVSPLPAVTTSNVTITVSATSDGVWTPDATFQLLHNASSTDALYDGGALGTAQVVLVRFINSDPFPSPSPSATPSATPSPSATQSPTPSATPTSSRTPSHTASPSRTPSHTPSPTTSPSPTPSPTTSPSPSPSGNLSPTPTPSPTPSASATSSTTPSRTPTPSLSPSNTPTPSPSPSQTPTPSPTPSRTASPSPTPTISVTPSQTPTISVTPSATPSASQTPSITPTNLPPPAPGLDVGLVAAGSAGALLFVVGVVVMVVACCIPLLHTYKAKSHDLKAATLQLYAAELAAVEAVTSELDDRSAPAAGVRTDVVDVKRLISVLKPKLPSPGVLPPRVAAMSRRLPGLASLLEDAAEASRDRRTASTLLVTTMALRDDALNAGVFGVKSTAVIESHAMLPRDRVFPLTPVSIFSPAPCPQCSCTLPESAAAQAVHHATTCSRRQLTCLACGESVAAKEYSRHRSTDCAEAVGKQTCCNGRRVRVKGGVCQWCKVALPLALLPEHEAVLCNKRPVRCMFGCGAMLPVDGVEEHVVGGKCRPPRAQCRRRCGHTTGFHNFSYSDHLAAVHPVDWAVAEEASKAAEVKGGEEEEEDVGGGDDVGAGVGSLPVIAAQPRRVPMRRQSAVPDRVEAAHAAVWEDGRRRGGSATEAGGRVPFDVSTTRHGGLDAFRRYTSVDDGGVEEVAAGEVKPAAVLGVVEEGGVLESDGGGGGDGGMLEGGEGEAAYTTWDEPADGYDGDLPPGVGPPGEGGAAHAAGTADGGRFLQPHDGSRHPSHRLMSFPWWNLPYAGPEAAVDGTPYTDAEKPYISKLRHWFSRVAHGWQPPPPASDDGGSPEPFTPRRMEAAGTIGHFMRVFCGGQGLPPPPPDSDSDDDNHAVAGGFSPVQRKAGARITRFMRVHAMRPPTEDRTTQTEDVVTAQAATIAALQKQVTAADARIAALQEDLAAAKSGSNAMTQAMSHLDRDAALHHRQVVSLQEAVWAATARADDVALNHAEEASAAANLAQDLRHRTELLREIQAGYKEARRALAARDKQVAGAQEAVRAATMYIEGVQEAAAAKDAKVKQREALMRSNLQKAKQAADSALRSREVAAQTLTDATKQLEVTKVANAGLRAQLESSQAAAQAANAFIDAHSGGGGDGGGGEGLQPSLPDVRPCPNGCGGNVLQSRMLAHLTEDCPCRWLPCPTCGVEMQAQQLSYHARVCTTCEWCGERFEKAAARDAHKAAQCPNRLVKCTECSLTDAAGGIPAAHMEAHRRVACGARTVKCGACRQSVKLVDVVDHLQRKCPALSDLKRGPRRHKKKGGKDGPARPLPDTPPPGNAKAPPSTPETPAVPLASPRTPHSAPAATTTPKEEPKKASPLTTLPPSRLGPSQRSPLAPHPDEDNDRPSRRRRGRSRRDAKLRVDTDVSTATSTPDSVKSEAPARRRVRSPSSAAAKPSSTRARMRQAGGGLASDGGASNTPQHRRVEELDGVAELLALLPGRVSGEGASRSPVATSTPGRRGKGVERDRSPLTPSAVEGVVRMSPARGRGLDASGGRLRRTGLRAAGEVVSKREHFVVKEG